MNDIPAEVIVLSSKPDYPALTGAEALAVERIRRRASKTVKPQPPLPRHIGQCWLAALITLMFLRIVAGWM